jgi:hypothetical protein
MLLLPCRRRSRGGDGEEEEEAEGRFPAHTRTPHPPLRILSISLILGHLWAAVVEHVRSLCIARDDARREQQLRSPPQQQRGESRYILTRLCIPNTASSYVSQERTALSRGPNVHQCIRSNFSFTFQPLDLILPLNSTIFQKTGNLIAA